MADVPKEIWAFPNGTFRTVEYAGHKKFLRADLVPQWQPIDTAPKDGTEIILGAPGQRSTACCWGTVGDPLAGYESAPH